MYSNDKQQMQIRTFNVHDIMKTIAIALQERQIKIKLKLHCNFKYCNTSTENIFKCLKTNCKTLKTIE